MTNHTALPQTLEDRCHNPKKVVTGVPGCVADARRRFSAKGRLGGAASTSSSQNVYQAVVEAITRVARVEAGHLAAGLPRESRLMNVLMDTIRCQMDMPDRKI